VSGQTSSKQVNHHESVEFDRVRQIISLLDLTNLNDDCDQASIDSLCSLASTPVAQVAAICVWPEFVSHARQCLGMNSDIEIATVVNFPAGNENASQVCAMIEKSLANGATEIDYVMPYAALIEGKSEEVSRAISTVRKNTPDTIRLKIIVESGILAKKPLIQLASRIAIDEGADFIKTSTGKVPIHATLDAASNMLEVIAAAGGNVGFKASGGIKSVQQACKYLELAENMLGADWVNTSHFRFGASGLLHDALKHIEVVKVESGGKSDY